MPHDNIVQIHLAGPTESNGFLIDTHDKPVPTPVWRLYKMAQELTEGVSTLLEWDANIPPYKELVAELMKSKSVLQGEIPKMRVQESVEQKISNPIDFQLSSLTYDEGK